MRWGSERRSDNVEDRRGISLRRGGAVGGGAIILAVVAMLLGAPQSVVRELLGGGAGDEVVETEGPPRPPNPAEEKQVDFVRVVLGSTEDVWRAVLPPAGATTCGRSWSCSATWCSRRAG